MKLFYHISQNVQGGKVLWLWNSTVIHQKTFVVPWLHGSLAWPCQLFHWRTFVAANQSMKTIKLSHLKQFFNIRYMYLCFLSYCILYNYSIIAITSVFLIILVKHCYVFGRRKICSAVFITTVHHHYSYSSFHPALYLNFCQCCLWFGFITYV